MMRDRFLCVAPKQCQSASYAVAQPLSADIIGDVDAVASSGDCTHLTRGFSSAYIAAWIDEQDGTRNGGGEKRERGIMKRFRTPMLIIALSVYLAIGGLTAADMAHIEPDGRIILERSSTRDRDAQEMQASIAGSTVSRESGSSTVTERLLSTVTLATAQCQGATRLSIAEAPAHTAPFHKHLQLVTAKYSLTIEDFPRSSSIASPLAVFGAAITPCNVPSWQSVPLPATADETFTPLRTGILRC